MPVETVVGDNDARPVDALVNPVNTVGVMGAGLAREFAQRYPSILEPYRAACRDGALTTGTVQVIAVHGHACRYIANFPTKTHWRTESRISHITEGLRALAAFVEQYQPTSMAVHALGLSTVADFRKADLDRQAGRVTWWATSQGFTGDRLVSEVGSSVNGHRRFVVARRIQRFRAAGRCWPVDRRVHAVRGGWVRGARRHVPVVRWTR